MLLELRQLCECPEHREAVGTWIYREWWSRAHSTPEVVLTLLSQHNQQDHIPYTVVALADGLPVGSCCVIENDCAHRPQWSPWVAAVFVKPEWRHRAIGSRLLQEAAHIASRANVAGLYIDCLTSTAAFYEANGWAIFEREVGDKDSVVLLRQLAANRP